jgi:opacity protein-like surface antigen
VKFFLGLGCKVFLRHPWRGKVNNYFISRRKAVKKKTTFVIVFTFILASASFSSDFSLGISASHFWSWVYLNGYDYSGNVNFEKRTSDSFESISYYRFAVSADIKYFWFESGLSVTGPWAEGFIYDMPYNDITEYGLFLSCMLKLPTKFGIFTIFPMAGIEYTYLIALMADGKNIKNDLSDEWKNHLNNRLTYKLGIGLDINFTKKMYLRIAYTKGFLDTDPKNELGELLEPLWDPELNNFMFEHTSITNTVTLMLGYKIK